MRYTNEIGGLRSVDCWRRRALGGRQSGPVYAKSHLVPTTTAKCRKPGNIMSLVELRVDAPAGPESSEQPLDLVPKLAEFAAAVPFDFPVRFRRHDRHHPQGLHKSAGLVALAGAVHRRRRIPTGWSQLSGRARPSGASWACPRNEFAASGLGNSASALSGSFHLAITAFGSPARNCRNWRRPRRGFPPRG